MNKERYSQTNETGDITVPMNKGKFGLQLNFSDRFGTKRNHILMQRRLKI